MRIIEWNIRQGGGCRTPAIIRALLAHNPDVVALTEFRNNDSGRKIQEALSNAGLSNQLTTPAPPHTNSVLLAAKSPLNCLTPPLGNEPHRHMAAECSGLCLFTLYFAQNELKRSLFNALLSLPPQYLQTATILLGDFNTGLHNMDEAGATFACADAFQALMTAGWTDAWRHHNGPAREYTWRSKTNGFRIDHLFASPAALASLAAVRYSHGERCPELSDHSILIAEYETKRYRLNLGASASS
jgi:exonuclease III